MREIEGVKEIVRYKDGDRKNVREIGACKFIISKLNIAWITYFYDFGLGSSKVTGHTQKCACLCRTL